MQEENYISNDDLIKFKRLGECLTQFGSAEDIATAQGFDLPKRMEFLLNLINEAYREFGVKAVGGILAVFREYNSICQGTNSKINLEFDAQGGLLITKQLTEQHKKEF